jgi:geranylgeranyl pyrophosphate synthase
MIYQSHSEAVFGRISSLLDSLAPGEAYRRTFDQALALVRADAEASPLFPPIDLPRAVGDLLGRPREERETAAAASTSLWAGADLMDDAADGQLRETWAGTSGRLLALVSTNLLSTLPHLLVASLDGCGDGVAGAYGRAVSEALFSMSEGQARDFESAAVVDSCEAYLDLVRRKSGSEFALFASTPAILAGADPGTTGAWLRFGLEYGTMVQTFNDTVSTIAEGPRNDLLAGKRTMPVVHTLSNSSDRVHLNFQFDLDMASKGDQLAVTRAIEAMVGAGSIRFSFTQVELLRYRATRALPVRLAEIEAGHPMRLLLSACSVI